MLGIKLRSLVRSVCLSVRLFRLIPGLYFNVSQMLFCLISTPQNNKLMLRFRSRKKLLAFNLLLLDIFPLSNYLLPYSKEYQLLIWLLCYDYIDTMDVFMTLLFGNDHYTNLELVLQINSQIWRTEHSEERIRCGFIRIFYIW